MTAAEHPSDRGKSPLVPVSLLTRVRQTAESVKRAERNLYKARLRHYQAIAAARRKHSHAEIGLVLGVTRQRVTQLVRWGKSQRKGGNHG